ncbi:MAG: stage III sporulation protein AE [Candidatus Limiplasma sp.]|nr:stage III sporulation protein AE [Candidatus Limiplasma sp.]
MRRALAVLALAALLWLGLPLGLSPGGFAPGTARAESLQEAVSSQIASMDLGALTRVAQEQDLLPADVPGLLQALTSGQTILDGPALWSWLGRKVTHAFQNSLWRMTRLLAPALLLGVLSHLRASLGREFVAKACNYAGMLLVLGFLVADMNEHAQLAKSAISGMASTMQALFPFLVTLLAAVGGRASAAFFQPAVVAASGTMTTLLQNVTLPFAMGLGVLTMVGSLCENLRITRLCKLMKQVAHWTLGFGFTVFIGVMMVQGLGSAAVDGVSIRTAKYAIDNFIPIVGGMFADTVDTLVGCSLLIKNAVGILGLFLLLATLVGPMLQTVCTLLLYSATAAVLEPVADSPLSQCIGEFSGVYTLLFIIELSVGAMFMLLVAQMLVVGNLTVMLR